MSRRDVITVFGCVKMLLLKASEQALLCVCNRQGEKVIDLNSGGKIQVRHLDIRHTTCSH